MRLDDGCACFAECDIGRDGINVVEVILARIEVMHWANQSLRML